MTTKAEPADRREQLQTWLHDLSREQEEVSTALEPLLRRKDELRQKIELVQRLLSLESQPTVEQPRVGIDANVEFFSADLPTGVGRQTGSELQEAVRGILAEHGKPMHISSIRDALIGKGIPIPGKGTDANIIVHLRRAPGIFERKHRGTYGLVTSNHRKPKEPQR